jgi:hypothetical protein
MSDMMHRSAPLPFNSRIGMPDVAEGPAEMDMADSSSSHGIQDQASLLQALMTRCDLSPDHAICALVMS